MERPETRFAWNGDVALAYQVFGSGEHRLLYLPGVNSNVDVMWEDPSCEQFLRRLGAFSRVLAIDRRGYGCSERFSPNDVAPLEVHGFFAAFDGPARAVRCAEAISRAVSALGVEVRIGLHTGECGIVDGKVSGIAAITGARVMAHAGASEILVSRTVKDLVAGSGLVFEDAGEHELKGVPERWRLYRVSE